MGAWKGDKGADSANLPSTPYLWGAKADLWSFSWTRNAPNRTSPRTSHWSFRYRIISHVSSGVDNVVTFPIAPWPAVFSIHPGEIYYNPGWSAIPGLTCLPVQSSVHAQGLSGPSGCFGSFGNLIPATQSGVGGTELLTLLNIPLTVFCLHRTKPPLAAHQPERPAQPESSTERSPLITFLDPDEFL